MKNLNSNELEKVKGGFSVWSGIAVAAIVVFVSGIIEGICNPRGCYNEAK